MEKRELAQLFGSVLREVRNSKKLSQEELADNSNLDRTYISMLERGIKTPTIQTIFQICNSMSVDPSIIVQKIQEQKKATKKVIKKNFDLPLFATAVSCGKPLGNDHIVEKVLSLDHLVIKNPKDTFFVRAVGESMFPSIQDDDYLVVEKTSHINKNGQVILAQIDNEFTIKRFFKENKKIILKCDNPSFADIVISDGDNFIVCGIVTSVVRQNI